MPGRISRHFADNTICIVTNPNKLEKPTIYLSVYHPTLEICDSCDLQAWCPELFGNGATCEIHGRKERWLEITDKQTESLKEILK